MIYMLKVKAESQGIGEICVALAGVCEVLAINQVEGEEPTPPLPPTNGKPTITRMRGKVPTDELITQLCAAREDKTVSRERIAAVFEKNGLSRSSVGPALSKLRRSEFFTVTEKSVRLTDLAITPENVHKALIAKGIR